MAQSTDFQQTQTSSMNITYSARYLSCKSSKCLICLTGKGHGPYWYASFTYDGKSHSVFMGDQFQPLDIEAAVNRIEEENRKTTEQQKPTTKKHRPLHSRPFSIRGKVNVVAEIKSTSALQPTQRDFNRDMLVLSQATQPHQLKTVYRQLIKKYHPDQHFGNIQMTHWMAEINSTYKDKLQRVRSAG